MIGIDMEMPEKCGLCPLFHAEHPMYCQGVKADRKKKIVAPYGQPRPDWCPLHPLDEEIRVGDEVCFEDGEMFKASAQPEESMNCAFCKLSRCESDKECHWKVRWNDADANT